MTFRRTGPWVSLAGAVLFSVTTARALDPRTGGTTLLETLDARAAALGEAGGTLTGDMAGVAFNPAAITTLDAPQLETQFQVAPGDVHTALVAYGRSGDRVGWGITVVGLDGGSIEVVPSGGGAATNRRAQQDLVLAAAGGAELVPWLRVGATGKYLQSRLAGDYSASTVAGDAGFLADLPIPGVRLGGSVQNMGPDLTFRSEGDPLPLFYRAGVSYSFSMGEEEDSFSKVRSQAWYAPDRMKSSRLWLGADAVFDRWGKVTGQFGLEWEQARIASLRLGGKVGEKSVGPTAGVGFLVGGWRFDYAIQLVNDLTDRHRVTVSYFFRTDD